MSDSGESYTTRVVRGTAWNTAGTVFRQGFTFTAGIIVARLLSPTDFATGGIALSILGFFTVLSTHGFAESLVQRQQLDRQLEHSVFVAMLVSGLGIATLIVVSAPWLASFYSSPGLEALLWLLAAAQLVSMAGSVPQMLLHRHLRFREINLIGMAVTPWARRGRRGA